MKQHSKFVKALLIVLFVIGICLIGAGYITEKKTPNNNSTLSIENSCKTELENMLRGIEGIGEMRLMIHSTGEGDSFAITGVAVICQGGADPAVQKDIIGIIGALWGVPSNRIYVTTMK